ncbi:MAG: hypothetical protein ACKOHG_02380, partial [Planctomycetia bacterium]
IPSQLHPHADVVVPPRLLLRGRDRAAVILAVGADRPLLVKRTDDALLVYSVGPDGEDDGGPVAPAEKKSAGTDDAGMRMYL